MKFGVLILYFNAGRTILRCIENCSSFVDIIYISYSVSPWSKYNSKARDMYKNNANTGILYSSKYIDKLKIVEGVWDSEEEQRNEVVNLARADGMDYLIIQDPDEFYLPEEYLKNIKGILDNPHFPFYYNPWINFWKNLNLIVLERINIWGTKFSVYSDSANFAINLKDYPDIHFSDRRLSNYTHEKGFRLKGVCYHLSYVYTDEEVKMKVETWGHSHQVGMRWMEYKWIAWRPSSKYINPTLGPIWQKVVKFEGKLPNELMNFPELNHKHVKLNFLQKISEFIYDLNQLRTYYIHQAKGLIAMRLKMGQFKRE